MRIRTSPDYAVEGLYPRNEGTTGYEPKRVRANTTVTTCKQSKSGLVALLLLTMIVALNILRDMHESITISDCESTIPRNVRFEHSCDCNLEQRFETFNKCPSPNANSRLCLDGHCHDYNQNLCPDLRRFYDEWYMVPTRVVSNPAVLENLRSGLITHRMNLIQICPSFFSLGRKELVQGLRFATTESNPNLFTSDENPKSFSFSLMLSTNSQFDSLDKFYRVKSTSFLTLCQVIVSSQHNLFF